MKHSRQSVRASFQGLGPFEIFRPQKLQNVFARHDIRIAVGEALLTVDEPAGQSAEERPVLEVDAQEFHIDGELAAHQLVVRLDVAGFVNVEREAVCLEDTPERDLDTERPPITQLPRRGVNEVVVSIESAGGIRQGYELHALGLAHLLQEVTLYLVVT